MITLSDGTTTITLHEDLFWSDEFTWGEVEQTFDRTITGAGIVMAAARIAGRPITLEPEADDSAWMHRTTVEALRNWATVPEKELVLTLRGEHINVLFRHQDGGFEARPVIHYNDVVSTDWYLCVVRLMTL